MKQTIEKTVKDALENQFGKIGVSFLVEAPKEKAHGDYSTNVALALAKELKKNPMEVAEIILEKIGKQAFLEKVEVASPGFINFYLSKDFFIKNVEEVLKSKEAFGKDDSLKGKKIMVEFTDPNPFKEFHIGHLMSNTIGESISKVLEFQGAIVKRANYQGDVGIHVAKAIFGKMKNPDFSWQQSYVAGNKAYEEDEAAQKEIVVLNKKIFEKSDKAVNKLYDQGKKESLKNFEEIYKKLGTKFDYYFFESQVADIGKKVVEEGLAKGVFEKGEKGAVIFKGEKVGLHTRVFINSENLPTYEAKDLALPELKYKNLKYDKSIIITAHEQNAYFDVMLAALKEMKPELAEKTMHIGHGMLRLSEGKMGSRKGNVITAESLIEKAKEMILEKIQERNFSEKDKQMIAEKVAIGALKYFILKQSIGGDVIYDSKKALSFEGDSGPYLQYALVRSLSILEKAKKERIKDNTAGKGIAEVSDLERMMIYFPEIVAKAGQNYEPHYISLYLTELASAFNNYYANNKIVGKEDIASPYKVAVAKAFSIIMKNGLWILGIPTPERM